MTHPGSARWLRLAGISAMLAAMPFLTGCNKLLANFSLGQAQKRMAAAQEHQADRFDAEGLSNTQNSINATQQMINSQQFKEARLKAKESAQLAKDLLERTKNARANFLKSETNRWIDILDKNEGRAENAGLYQTILDGNAKGNASFDKQKWEPAIAAFDKAVNDSQFLLENLKRSSEQGLREVDTMKETLVAEGAPEHFPEAIIQIDDFRARIEDLITAKFEYRTALITRDQARQSAEAGITKTKEIKSDKLLRQIEAKLSTALQLGADIYATRTLEDVSREFEDLLKQFYEQKYDSVLTTGPNLAPRADALIVETQRESARAKIDAVTKAIASLVEGKAKIYLPGRVEQLETMLQESQTKFDAQTYTDSEQVSLRALEEEKRIVDAFNGLAQKEIQDASGSLTVAQGIFTRMQDIFAQPAPGPVSGDDLALEQGKQAKKEELRAVLDNASIELGVATLKREEKVFHEGIEIAKRVVSQADQVVQETYRVVTHNAILELNNEITRYEREGGREYAAAELSKTQTMVNDAREILKTGDTRKAVEAANEAKSQLEILAQELARVALGKIETAKTRLASAEKLGAETYQKDLLEQARAATEQARSELDKESVKEAIDIAVSADAAAGEAGNRAIRQWAEDEMRRTDILLQRARESGAESYAPSLLDEAVNLRQNAGSLFDSGNLDQAQSVAGQAAASAEKALYARVIDAEDEISKAQRSEGWKYESERLAQAIVNAKIAREAMDRGNYQQANLHAEQSLGTAREITAASRRAGFKDRIASLEAKVDVAANKGVGYYQIKDLSTLVGGMSRLRTEFAPEGYEDALQQVELIEARLQALVETTPNVLQELVEHMNDRQAALEERGARTHVPDLLAETSKKIRLAQIDYKNEDYRASFTNTRDALELLDLVALRLDERDYDRKLGEYFTQVSDLLRNYAPVLNMGSPVLWRLAQGPNGRSQAVAILSASKPTDLREEINDVAAQVSLMQPPSTRVDVQEAAMQMFERAKNGASGFEKLLILDQYSLEEARRIIETAYIDMRTARSEQQEIQRMLESTVAETQQKGVRVLQARQ